MGIGGAIITFFIIIFSFKLIMPILVTVLLPILMKIVKYVAIGIFILCVLYYLIK